MPLIGNFLKKKIIQLYCKNLLVLKVSFAFFVCTAFLFLFASTINAACTRTVTNTNNSGSGSLRQAIIDSNVSSDLDEICFNISGGGVKTIAPTSSLTAITQPAIIDGTSQPSYSGSPLIEINGQNSGSGSVGIWITAGGSTIKGLIINRFSANGIFITNSSGNTIVSNYIGTDSTGTVDLGNGTDGIGIYNSPNHTIGGTNSSDRNLVSGNQGNGIGITSTSGAGGNVILGNYIGTKISGTEVLANSGDGILINDSPNNTIGGTTGTTPGGACTGACNLISGNSVNGIGLWYSGSSGNTIQGNYIGVTVSGTVDLANGDIGVEINESPSNTVGGTSANARNILSGNIGAGLLLTGASSINNVVSGNYIGTNAAGTAGIANRKMGISIGNSPGIGFAKNNTIGGTTGTTPGGACTGACNLISGNLQDGIFITGNSGGGNQFQGNYIGTNAAGTGAIPNVLDGVGILNSPNNRLGDGTTSGRNIISGNSDNGIIIVGSSSTGNRLESNYLGLTTDGNNLGNSGAGVMITGGVDTAMLGNSIYSNSKLGIDLGYNNVTKNDSNDGDSGPNRLQNFPVVYSSITVSNTKVYGNLKSNSYGSYRLEFFSSQFCNAGSPNNFGEGQTYLGTTNVNTDSFGNVDFTFTSPTLVNAGNFITATATKLIGSTAAETSEFSECNQVNASKPAVVSGSTWYQRTFLVSGSADNTFNYGFPAKVLMCAWDSTQSGLKLPVIFSSGTWYMHKGFYPGPADLTFGYGAADANPVCGDWDGDGTDTIGTVSANKTWSMRNTNNSGPADINFQYGPYDSTPIVGDWDGNGTDTIGIMNPGNGWSLRNSNSSGPENVAFQYGFPGAKPVTGDWNGDGTDTPGVIGGTTWFLRNDNSSGVANISLQFGFTGAKFISWK